ncbi:sulfotransferase domain-containing protein [Roseovarius autotrophicus]|uniref:sulfotransferase domain-containing protein n=1 Tax=Roseovarius autotrophicus TaxID=2824121 RepID=UPI001B36CDA2|nr:sulfotransferase domain-containing protein [Roseovarius autotrophicus]
MSDTFRLLRATLPEASKVIWRKAARRLLDLRLTLAGASDEDRLRAERRLRGYQHFTRLKHADAVVVSFGKSGRTWLRVMVSRLYQQVYALPEDILIGFDNFHNMDARIPRVFFTHDNYIGDYTGNTDNKSDFYDKKVLLLMRDPRDVAVSQFFQWRYRMRPGKKALNDYLPDGDDSPIYDFVMHEGGGLPKVIAFMNLWAREMPNVRALELVRYEDMRADPVEAMTRVARFLDIPATGAQVQDAVDFASYENMKKKETDQSFRLSGGRMAPRDQDNPDSFKVRRAKVGGYRDYFDDAQIAAIDAMMAERLDPIYGYSAPDPAAG